MTQADAADARAVSGAAGTAEESRREEFAELLSAHWDHVYRLAYRLTGHPEDAEDLMQQASEEAFRAFDRFRLGTRFDRWMMRIVHNSFVDQVRRTRRRRMFSLDEVPARVLAAGHWSDPVEAAEGSLDGPVQQALDALPPEYRAPVVLVDLMDLSYEDTAAILRCPIGTVRSRLHRGRLALREWLRPYVDAQKRGTAE